MGDPSAELFLDKIDRNELVDLAIKLANIYSPPGHEREAADFVFDWLKGAGFEPEKIGMVPETFSVVAKVKGKGTGYSLLFNSHLDQITAHEDHLLFVDPKKRGNSDAWIEGDDIYGYGVVNDKGPLAAFLIAAKAMKESGVHLKGDVILTAVPGEIGHEPVEEFGGPFYHGKDLGAKYMVTHGVVADYAIVAECTNFCPVWVNAGKAFFKITVYGEASVYTPFLARPTTPEESPNAIPRMTRVVQELEKWAYDYERRKTREYPGGTVIPKASVNAVRAGLPYKLIRTPELCNVYLDVRLLPGEGPLGAQSELSSLLKDLGIPFDIKLVLYRKGYEGKNVDRPLASLVKAHKEILGGEPKRAIPPYSSMWRDSNVFNEMGIPSVDYGPTGFRPIYHLKADDLLASSKIYALTAYHLCNQEKGPAGLT